MSRPDSTALALQALAPWARRFAVMGILPEQVAAIVGDVIDQAHEQHTAGQLAQLRANLENHHRAHTTELANQLTLARSQNQAQTAQLDQLRAQLVDVQAQLAAKTSQVLDLRQALQDVVDLPYTGPEPPQRVRAHQALAR